MPIGNPRWLPMQDIVLTHYHIGKYRKNLFLKNYWAEWTHSVHEWSLNGLLLTLCFLCGSMSLVAGSNNSYKPITNTAWVCAQLYKLQKGCTRLAAASDKVYQLLAHGRWFSPASSTTKTGRHDIAEILLKVALKHQKSINQSIN